MAKETQNSGLAHNALAFETTITGNITSPKDIRIDGHNEGDVSCGGKVVVGEKGTISGTITAVNAEIMGQIVGAVSVSEMLVLKATAVFEGEICACVLSIEPGATLTGRCTMNRPDSPRAEIKKQ